MKKSVFIVAADGSKLDTEADLFAKLDSDEAFLIKKHPDIDKLGWRVYVDSSPDLKQDYFAIKAIDRLRALRDALQDLDTPTWRVAALAIEYQNLLMIYRQPVTYSAVGKFTRQGQLGRIAEDTLCMSVLSALRAEGLTFNDAICDMQSASADLLEIVGVELDYSEKTKTKSERFRFKRPVEGGPNKIENFAVSTLKNKWSKAKKDR
jgi:hypothetical protein